MSKYMRVVLLNLIDGSTLEFSNVEHAYMIGHSTAVIGLRDGSETYYTNYKINLKEAE